MASFRLITGAAWESDSSWSHRSRVEKHKYEGKVIVRGCQLVGNANVVFDYLTFCESQMDYNGFCRLVITTLRTLTSRTN